MAHRNRIVRRPGRPAGNLRRDARELLLIAAVELFAEQGIAATTFATVAKRVGLTPAMMHYYFADRDALIDAVVDERLAPLIASVWDPVQPKDTVADMICGVVERLLAGIERNPWVPSTWMREVLNEGGLLRGRILRHLPFDKIRMVSAAIVRSQKNRTIHPDIDPVLIVFSMLGLVMLHTSTVRLFAEIFHREVPDSKTVFRHITGVLLHGVEGSASAPRKAVRRKR